MANPPLPIKLRDLPKHVWAKLISLSEIVWQILTPYKGSPERVNDLPDPNAGISVNKSHVKQCQWIFDQAEQRRSHLEQKAQSSFGLMVFLVPLLGSIFAFIISKTNAGGNLLHGIIMGLLALSGALLLLGFISAARAVSVKEMETLYIASVVADDGQFRQYKEDFHARGLLYCAARNEAMNDHIAQFVKGAHILTAGAVMMLAVASIPTSYVLSALPSTLAESKIVGLVETKIVGPVDVAFPDFLTIRSDVALIKEDIAKLMEQSHSAAEDFKKFEYKFAMIDAKLNRMQKTMHRDGGK